MKKKIAQVNEHAVMYKDSTTGIVWIEDGSTGLGHSAHPNIDASGSERSMKIFGYWGKNDRCVESHGFIYNTDLCVLSTPLDKLAAQNCECGGIHS